MSKTSLDELPAEGGRGNGPLLDVDNLHVEFATRAGVVRAVNGVSYSLNPGETVAVLGESGSGKSVTAQAIMGILDVPPARIPQGEVRFHGTDLLKLSEEARTQVRGQRIAMIFQDALSALNPVFTVGWQISEMFRVHRGMSKRDGMKKAVELMDKVRIPAAKQRVNDYPHQFSGGMRQRIMIAMALLGKPRLLLADEPTTALDVTVQDQVLKLIYDITVERGTALLLVSHDLNVVRRIADKVSVMYAGRIAETGLTEHVLSAPKHPYTDALLRSAPSLTSKPELLTTIPGRVPTPAEWADGCRFAQRCEFATERCMEKPPVMEFGNQSSACWHTERLVELEHTS